jgi:hypothetical protein
MAKGVSAQEDKRNKLNHIKNFIEKVFAEGGEVDKKKLMAFYEVEFGISKTRMKEYVETLQTLMEFSDVEGVIKNGRI